MTSIYPMVSPMYTRDRSVHLRYPCVSVCPPTYLIPSLLSMHLCTPPPPQFPPCQAEWWWCWETDFHPTMAFTCISKFSQLASPGTPTILLEYLLQPNRCNVCIWRDLDNTGHIMIYISKNPSFRLKHPGVPDGSDGSDGTSYPLTENYTLPVAQAPGHVA